MPFKRENRYLVIKHADIQQYLDRSQQEQLELLQRAISVGRSADGKPPREYVCISSDWPEYELAWKLIEYRSGRRAWKLIEYRSGRRAWIDPCCTETAGVPVEQNCSYYDYMRAALCKLRQELGLSEGD